MKRFLVLAHTAPLSGGFTLNDLPGAAGRIDVLCRAIGASLLVSHGIRRDVETLILIRDEILVRIEGERVKYLNPDERSTAALLGKALDAAPVRGAPEARSTPGITVARASLSEAIQHLSGLGARPIVLHEAGGPVESFEFPENPLFILSDHHEFSDADTAAFQQFPTVSLGKMALHTSQCITLLHYFLDRQEANDVR